MQSSQIIIQSGLKPSRSSHQLQSYYDASSFIKQNQLKIKPLGDEDSCDDHLSVYDEAFYSGNNAADLVPPSYIQHIKRTIESSPGKNESLMSNSPNSKMRQDQVQSILKNGSGDKRNRNNNHSQVSFDTTNILNSSANQNNLSGCLTANSLPKQIANFANLNLRPCGDVSNNTPFDQQLIQPQPNPNNQSHPSNQSYPNILSSSNIPNHGFQGINIQQQQQNSQNVRKSTESNQLNTQGSRTNLYDVSGKYINLNQTCKNGNPILTSQNGSKFGSTFEFELKRNSSLGQIMKQDSDLSYLKQSEYIKTLEQNSKLQAKLISKDQQDEYSKKLTDQNDIYKNKKQQLAEDVKKQQMSECTFAPKVNDYGGRRSTEQFCELQKQFKQYVEQKKQMVREHVEEQRMAEVTDRPTILPKSKQIMEQKRLSEIPAYARLYYLHRKDTTNNENIDTSNQNTVVNKGSNTQSQMTSDKYYKNKDTFEETRRLNLEKEQKENTFKPKIHSKSKSLKRGEKIDVLLYKDAKRRQENQEKLQKESKKRSRSTNSSKFSQSSEIILIQKFTKEFNQICSQLQLKDTEYLELQNVFELLIKQGFIKYYYEQEGPVIENEKRLVFLLWSLIGGEKFGQIKKENLILFLLCVLGLGINSRINDKELEQILKATLQQQNTNIYQGGSSVFGNTIGSSHLFINQIGNNNLTNPSSRIQTEPGTVNRLMSDDQYNQSESPNKLLAAAQYINNNSQNQNYNDGGNNSGYKARYSLDLNNQNSNINISFQGLGKNSFSGQKINHIFDQFRVDEIPEEDSEQNDGKYQNNSSSGKRQSSGNKYINNSNIFQNEISNSIYNVQLGYFEEDTKQWVIGSDDKKVIHQAFEVLYRNRLAYEELKNNKHDWEYTFQPQLTNNSVQLANQYREKILTEAAHLLETQQIKMKIPEDGKISHQQLLVLQKLSQQQQIQKKKEELEKGELSECSFQPAILQLKKVNSTSRINTLSEIPIQQAANTNTNICDLASAVLATENQISSKPRLTTLPPSAERGNKKTDELFSLALPKTHKRDRTRDEIEFEKFNEQCTFNPEISKGKRSYKQEQLYAKNIDKTIDRMRNAYKEREILNQAKQRGYTRHSLGGMEDLKPESTKNSKISSNNISSFKSPSSNQNSTMNKPPIPQSSSNRNGLKSNQNQNNSSALYQFEQNTNTTTIINNNQSSFLQERMNNNQGQNNVEDQILLSSKNQTDSSFIIQQQLQYQQQQQFFSSVNSQKNINNIQSNQQLTNQQYSSNHSNDSQHNSRPNFQQNTPSPAKTMLNKQVDFPQQQTGQMNIQDLNVQQQPNQQIPNQSNTKSSSQSQSQQDSSVYTASSYNNSGFQENNQKIQYGNNINQNIVVHDHSSSQTPNKSAASSTSQYIKSEEKVPLLFVDVNLGLGRTERIVVYEGDKSEDLANKFAQVHNLDTVTKQKFKELLDNQIAGLLSRIDEEEMLSYESESQNHSAILQQHYYFQNYNNVGSNQMLTNQSSQKNLLNNQPQTNSQYNSLNASSNPQPRLSYTQQYN